MRVIAALTVCTTWSSLPFVWRLFQAIDFGIAPELLSYYTQSINVNTELLSINTTQGLFIRERISCFINWTALLAAWDLSLQTSAHLPKSSMESNYYLFHLFWPRVAPQRPYRMVEIAHRQAMCQILCWSLPTHRLLLVVRPYICRWIALQCGPQKMLFMKVVVDSHCHYPIRSYIARSSSILSESVGATQSLIGVLLICVRSSSANISSYPRLHAETADSFIDGR